MAQYRKLSITQWNAMGLRIRKGMKAYGHSEDGTPLFHELHTYRPKGFRFEVAGGSSDSAVGDWDDND